MKNNPNNDQQLQLFFDDWLKRMHIVCEEREKHEKERIKNLEPKALNKNNVPKLQAPSQIYHVPKIFGLKKQHEEKVLRNEQGEILMAVAPAPSEFGGKPIVDDILIIHTIIGLYLEEQKKAPKGHKVEKITFSAKWFLKKAGFPNPGGKDVAWLKNGLLRLNMTSYFGKYFSDRGWQGSFKFIEFLEFNERVIKLKADNKFPKASHIDKEALVLDQIVLVLARQIIEEIQRNPNFYHLGDGFKKQNGGFRKLLWFYLCGHVWRTNWMIGETKLKDLMESGDLSDRRFREKIRRSLDKMPWNYEMRKGIDGKLLYFFTPK